MCFTPEASLITAIIELGIFFYLYKRIKTKKYRVVAYFVLLLCLYQITEFMLCSFSVGTFWARAGYITYTFMPAVLLHIFFNLTDKKMVKWVYVFPLFFSSLAVLPDFVVSASCNFIHVSIQNLVFGSNPLIMYSYLIYYGICPVYGIYIFSIRTKEEFKNDKKLKVGLSFAPLAIILAQVYYLFLFIQNPTGNSVWIAVSFLIILLGLILVLYGSLFYSKGYEVYYRTLILVSVSSPIIAILLYYFLPLIRFDLSSIFCQFALLYAITSILLIDVLDNRKQ